MSHIFQLQEKTIRFLRWCTTDLDLRHAGKPLVGQHDASVASWEAALASIQTTEWDDFYLDRQNDLSGDVFMQYHHRYGKQPQWNNRVMAIQSYLTTPHYHNVVQTLPLSAPDQSFIHQAITDDCLRMALTIEFAGFHTTTFFDGLRPIYEAGHFPCGWSGRYPSGHMLLF